MLSPRLSGLSHWRSERARSWWRCLATRMTGIRREARRILAERRDPAVIPGLKKTILADQRAARPRIALGPVRQRRVRRRLRSEAVRPPQRRRPRLDGAPPWRSRRRSVPRSRDRLVELAAERSQPHGAQPAGLLGEAPARARTACPSSASCCGTTKMSAIPHIPAAAVVGRRGQGHPRSRAGPRSARRRPTAGRCR